MQLSKENVLSRTEQGRLFYEHVFAEKLIPKLGGYHNAKSPFYSDTKASLSIYKNEGQWFFKDHGNPDHKGDVFNFAALHYKLNANKDFFEILRKINQDLSLDLKERTLTPIEKELKKLKNNYKKDSLAYLKSRGIYLTKGFFQKDTNGKEPAALIFPNNNKTGFEKRYLLSNELLAQKSLPKTKYTGTKANTLYVECFQPELETVFIVEGSIDALSFAQIHQSAIATFGAGNIPDAKTIEPFIKNKIVYLAGDGDSDGQKFNVNLLNIIAAANIPTKQILTVNFPEGKDANDLLQENQLNEFTNYSKIAFPLYNYPALIHENGLNDVFPIQVFPPDVKSLIIELRNALNFPVNFSAVSILTAISFAIGNNVKLKIKAQWIEHAALYMALVGRAGVNKSHPLAFALRPILEEDERNKRQYDIQREKYEFAKEMSKEERSDADVEDFEEPILKQIIVNDITQEALIHIHGQNPRGLGLYADEFLGWIKRFDRYSQGGEIQNYLSAWSGQVIKVNRIGRGAISLSNPFISVCGTIQTPRLNDLASNNFLSTGFLDRILFAFSEIKEKPYLNENELEQHQADFYASFLNKLLQIPEEYDVENKLVSRILQFSIQAKQRFLAWNKYNTDLVNSSFTTDEVKSLYVKLDVYIGRIIILLQMAYWAVGNANTQEVSLDIVEKSILVVEFFRKNAIYAHSFVYPENKNVSKNNFDLRSMATYLKNDRKMSVRVIADILGKGKSTVGEWLKDQPDAGQRTKSIRQ